MKKRQLVGNIHRLESLRIVQLPPLKGVSYLTLERDIVIVNWWSWDLVALRHR